MDNSLMIEEQVIARNIRDPRALAALRAVDRALFVPPEHEADAYTDQALPVAHGQTISQPYIVALMTETLQVGPGHRVLEIGTGTGYQTAILAQLAREVWSLEIVPDLAHEARRRLQKLRLNNVIVMLGSGFDGLPERAPFDRILSAAAPPEIPQPLLEQLAIGGRLVCPVGPVNADQQLLLVIRTGPDEFERQTISPVRFVPMVRQAGEKPASA